LNPSLFLPHKVVTVFYIRVAQC